MSVTIPEAAFNAGLASFAALGCVRTCLLNGRQFQAVRSGPGATPGNVEHMGNDDGAQFRLRFLKSAAGYGATDKPAMPTDDMILVQDGEEGAFVRYRMVGWECGAVTIAARCAGALV